jgi:hypothetical protein
MALFRKKIEPIDRRRSLKSIPVMNRNVVVKPGEEGTLVISVTMQRKKGLFSRFLPPVFERHLKLDELGSFVVSQIDGRKSVLDIIEAFIAKYDTNRRETELSVVSFLKSLVQRQLVSIAVK